MRKNLVLVGTFLLAGAFAAFIAGCSSDENGGGGGASFSATTYYPLGLGAEWIFVNDSGDTAVYRIPDTLTIDGHLVYRMIYTEPGETDTTLATVINGGIYAYISDLDSFVCLLPATFSIGQSWVVFSYDSTWNSGGYDYHAWYEMNVKVMGTESVPTPAGSFNAIKFMSVEESGYSIAVGDSTIDDVEYDTSYSWLAANVGEVKNLESDGTTWSLVEYFLGNPVK
ncbi:hypothetical protein J7K99_07805 [bacterium]|nr:hypothetical protein [bacterium]